MAGGPGLRRPAAAALRRQHQGDASRSRRRPAGTSRRELGYNSLRHHGWLSLVPLPAADDLPRLSQAVWDNLRRERIEESLQPPRPGQPARAIPERIGEPSLIKHVVYIIKENRTYDQVLGDVAAGQRRSAALRLRPADHAEPAQARPRVRAAWTTPTAPGSSAPTATNWSTSALATDYLERSFAGFPRSYPAGRGDDESDAVAYSPAGFLWDRAIARGVSLRNYGERMGPSRPLAGRRPAGKPDFAACYRAWKDGTDDVIFESQPMIASLGRFSPTNYVGWNLTVPDQYRADVILRELKDFEARGEFPSLVLVWLPNDHTNGDDARRPDARGDGRRQRPGHGPDRRGPEPFAVLEGDGHLRHRGRPAERLGPRERLPHHGLPGQPLRPAQERSSASTTAR